MDFSLTIAISQVILFTLTYRLRGMGYADENKTERIHKPIFFFACVAILYIHLNWLMALLVASAIYVASKPSLGEQYGKILGNFDGGFKTDLFTNWLIPEALWEKPKLWAHLAMITRGLWFSLPFLIMGQFLTAILAPVAFYFSYAVGAYGYSHIFKKSLGNSWQGGEYVFGFVYIIMLLWVLL